MITFEARVVNKFNLTALQNQLFKSTDWNNNPRFPFFAGGVKSKFLNAWLEINRSATRYVDVTMGSGNQAFAIGKTHKIPVTVNDISYFSYCIGCSLFHRHRLTNFNTAGKTLIDAQDFRKEGVFCRNRSDHPKFGNQGVPTLPHELTSYVDGLIELINLRHSFAEAMFLKACVGRTFLYAMSMKNLKWYSSIEKGIMFSFLKIKPTATQFAKYMFRSIKNKNKFFTPGAAFHLSARDFLGLEGLNLSDATVNIDPPWPHRIRELKQINPSIFYNEISEILFQGEVEKYYPWHSEEPEKAVEEVIYLAHLAFYKGAREVFVWDQTTNLPMKEVVRDMLQEQFHCEEILTIVQPSKGYKYNFRDFVFRLTRKK